MQKREKLKNKKNVKPDPGEPEFGNEHELLFLPNQVLEKVYAAIFEHDESNAGTVI